MNMDNQTKLSGLPLHKHMDNQRKMGSSSTNTCEYRALSLQPPRAPPQERHPNCVKSRVNYFEALPGSAKRRATSKRHPSIFQAKALRQARTSQWV